MHTFSWNAPTIFQRFNQALNILIIFQVYQILFNSIRNSLKLVFKILNYYAKI